MKKIIIFVAIVFIAGFAFIVSRSGDPVNNPNKIAVAPPVAINYKQVKTDSRIQTIIDSSRKINNDLIIKFHHNSIKEEPVSVSGHVKYELSKTTAKPGETVDLTVFGWSTEYFEIKIGQQSDHFGFGNQAESLDNDRPVLKELQKQGINKDDVILEQDYASREYGNPYAKTYRDTKSGKGIVAVSSLPMVAADGTPIDVGWDVNGNKFTAKNNLFSAVVDGNNVELALKNDQPDGRKKNDKLSFHAQLFLNNAEQTAAGPTLLATDPINSNYANNTLEWDYGIAKRRLRLIEGHVLGSWIFITNPGGDIRIVYNQSGDFKLQLGEYKVDEDTELVKKEVFSKAKYPFAVSDTGTFYPDAHTETTSVDGYVSQYGYDTWANLRSSSGTNALDNASLASVGWQCQSDAGIYYSILRGIVLFDTSGLSGGTVNDATLSLYGMGAWDSNSYSPSWNIYAAAPASNTALASTDFANVSSTAFSTAINYSAWIEGYNAFSLNSSGIAAIATSGVSKFSIRDAGYDVANVAPDWYSYGNASMQFTTSEYGVGYQPKLVVTYNEAPTSTPTPTITPTPTSTPTPTPLPWGTSMGNWSKRKTITLSRASGAVTNYQMKLLVGETSGATGEDVDVGGYIQTDFDDLRFTNVSGTVLDYWIESLSGTTPNQLATVWVEFDSIGTSATTFYMYYSNPSATAASNGVNTFIVFDDFERGNNEDAVGGIWNVYSGSSVVISTEQTYGGTRSMKLVGGATAPYVFYAYNNTDFIEIMARFFKETAVTDFRVQGGIIRVVDWKVSVDASNDLYYDVEDTLYDTTKNVTPDTWQILKFNNFNFTGYTYDIYLNDVLAKSGAGMSPRIWGSGVIGFGTDDTATKDVYVDNVIVRNWRATEPAWGSWGAQENAQYGINIRGFNLQGGINLR